MREWDELGEYDDWEKLGKWNTFGDWGELVEWGNWGDWGDLSPWGEWGTLGELNAGERMIWLDEVIKAYAVN